jgi:CheY-like chemotaxis protein/HPt (histidine-containing phosphotransfer) domain-containing protein
MLKNNKILLVEDSDSDRFLFSRYLLQLGYDCECFENGKQLIDNIDKYPSSLVLLDIELPVMNGIETALHLRKLFCNGEKRFILIGLTSHNDPQVLEEIAASGFDNCLHKPLRKRELETKLKQYISTSMNQNNHSNSDNESPKQNKRLYSLEMFEPDDPEFLQSIIGMFVSSTPPAIEAMKQSFEKLEWEPLRMQAHKLKPHFNYFMITEGAHALQELEELARHSTGAEKIPGLLQLIEQTGKQVINEMKEDFPLGE